MHRATSMFCSLTAAFASSSCTQDMYTVPPDVTLVYVVSGLDIPAPIDGATAGFDLDHASSDGTGDDCVGRARDFTSLVSGATGVDNQFALAVPVLETELPDGVAGMFGAEIAAGSYLLVMEVTTSSLREDQQVEVHLYLAETAGPACDATHTCPPGSMCLGDATSGRCGPRIEGGVIVAGQTLLAAMDIGTVPATITGSRIELDVDGLPLRMLLGDADIELRLVDAHISADITAAHLSNGEIGGTITVENLIEEAGSSGIIAPDPGTSFADLGPNADGTSCSGVSIGLTFEAVEAAVE